MELEIIRFIQSFHNPVLDILFQAITILAEQYVLILVFCWVYWNVDKEKGQLIAYGVFSSLVINSGVKEIFKAPRPIGQEGIRTLRQHTATGYSFPSGHSQTASSAGLSVALAFQKNWLYLLSVVYMLLVGLSRIYLGVHYPRDVVVGLLLGGIVAVACCALFQMTANRPALFAVTWLCLLPFAFVARSLDFYKALAAFAGLTAGLWLEERAVNFSVRISARRKAARFLLGMTVVLAVQLGLKAVLPASLPFTMARYGLVGFMGMGGCPYLFQKLGI